MKITTIKLPSEKVTEDIWEWLFNNCGKGVVDDNNAWANPEITWAMWTSFVLNDRKMIEYWFFEFKNYPDAALFRMRWE